MDLKGIMLSEISQTEKDKYCMLPLTCGKLKQINPYNKTDSEIQATNQWLPVRRRNGKGHERSRRLRGTNY